MALTVRSGTSSAAEWHCIFMVYGRKAHKPGNTACVRRPTQPESRYMHIRDQQTCMRACAASSSSAGLEDAASSRAEAMYAAARTAPCDIDRNTYM